MFKLCDDDEFGKLFDEGPFAFDGAFGVVDRLFEFPFAKLPLLELLDECILLFFAFLVNFEDNVQFVYFFIITVIFCSFDLKKFSFLLLISSNELSSYNIFW